MLKTKDYARKKRTRRKEIVGVTEPIRTSVYDLMLKNLKANSRVTCLHRIIYIGTHTVGPNESPNISAHLQKNIMQVNSTCYDEPITGYLMYHSRYFMHVLDGTEEAINKHLSLLFDGEENRKKIDTIKVLVVYHNINQRFLNNWTNIAVKVPSLVHKFDPSDITQKIIVCVTKLYAVGMSLRVQVTEEIEVKPTMSGILQKETFSPISFVRQRVSPRASCVALSPTVGVPEHQILDYLLDCPLLMDIKEYMNEFGKIPTLYTFNDKCWPVSTDFIPHEMFDKEYDPVTDIGTRTAADQFRRFMAGGFWLTKVIVVFALFRINCARDDLLDRVRLSKSNEPEVREFLKSVLKHHNDFRWIAHEASKVTRGSGNGAQQQMPNSGGGGGWQGLLPQPPPPQTPLKMKRSFYDDAAASAADEDMMLDNIGAGYHYDASDADVGGNAQQQDDQMQPLQLLDEQSEYAPSADFEQQPMQQVAQDEFEQPDEEVYQSKAKAPPPDFVDEVDFDGPVNDIYPYEEDAGMPLPTDRRLARDAQEPFLLDDTHDDMDDDFLASDGDDEARFVADERAEPANSYTEHRRRKRATSTEELLNEKLALHSLLHKGITKPLRKTRIGRLTLGGVGTGSPTGSSNSIGEKTFDALAGHMPGDAIEVIPSSQNGVHYAPGTKYERFGESVKADQDQRYGGEASHAAFKRKCSEVLADSDFKVPDLFGPNTSQIDNTQNGKAEFYYSVPHDVLGINQDISAAQVAQNNTCRKFKRGMRWDGIIARNTRNDKKRKAIKIKIFDDGQLVKDIKKGDGVNSIILTIKNSKANDKEQRAYQAPATTSIAPDSEPAFKYFNDLNQYSNNLYNRYSNNELIANVVPNDNTLQKIDTILQHDEASLKLNSQFPQTLGQHKSTENEVIAAPVPRKMGCDDVHVTLGTARMVSRGDSGTITKGITRATPSSSPPSPPSPSSSPSPESIDSTRAKMESKMTETEAPVPVTISHRSLHHRDSTKQNRLEDQTEPTSAAEQRELGKVDNKFTTSGQQSTTEKMIIIPLRKSVKSVKSVKLVSMAQKAAEAVPVSAKKRHETKTVSKEKLIDSKLKESDDVLGQLRNDLEQTMRSNIQENAFHGHGFKHLLTDGMNNQLRQEAVDKARKRSNDDIAEDMEPKVRSYPMIRAPQAQTYRSRKLFAVLDGEQLKPKDGDDDVSAEFANSTLERLRRSDDIRNTLGMRNDEDYMEDKVDFYDPMQPKQKKHHAGKKADFNTLKAETRRLLGSLVNSQQERLALKSRMARTKANKVKKDISVEIGALSEDDAVNEGGEPDASLGGGGGGSADAAENMRTNYQHVVVKDVEHHHPVEEDEKVASERHVKAKSDHALDEEQNAATEKRKASDSRCCENGDSKNGTCSSSSGSPAPSTGGGGFGSSGGSSDGGGDAKAADSASIPKNCNELDIIEKTQAILLHITCPPPSAETTECATTGSGEMDEHDDPGAKANNPTAGLTVKRLNQHKIATSVNNQNPEDVVSEIIKLVQNYKNKVNENSKKVAPIGGDSKAAPSVTAGAKHFGISAVKEKQPQQQQQAVAKKGWLEEAPTTQSNTDNKDVVDDKIIMPEEEDEVALHAHGAQHAKKLHPLKDKEKCDLKQGTDMQNREKINKHLDHEQDFQSPMQLKEGYAKPEVVADNETNDVDNLTEDPQPEDDVKKQQKRATQDNPLSFTPDNVDSFREIVEAAHDENDAGALTIRDARVKRDVDATAENDYNDDELDKLIAMVGDASEKLNADHARRIRRFRNFQPMHYNSFPRYRQVPPSPPTGGGGGGEAGGGGGGPGGAGDAAAASATTKPPAAIEPANALPKVTSELPMCHDVEYKPGDNPEGLIHHGKAGKKHSGGGHRCNFDEPDEFGDTCVTHVCSSGHGSKPTCSDSRMREKNREKINQEKLVEKQKEQEHIKNVLNGHIVLELMEKFQKQVKENGRLNARFGEAMGKKCAQDQVKMIDEFRDSQSKSDVRHAQLMLHQVIVMMNKIVAEQVHRRTCLILSPALKNFLKRLTSVTNKLNKSMVVAEGYPLPSVKEGIDRNKMTQKDEKQGDFLFPAIDNDEMPPSPVEAAMLMKKKIQMIRTLLAKYNHMSHSCQVRVEPVREYLHTHLKTLERLYKNKQFEELSDSCDVKCLHNDFTGPTAGAPTGGAAGATPAGSSSPPGGETGSAERSTVAGGAEATTVGGETAAATTAGGGASEGATSGAASETPAATTAAPAGGGGEGGGGGGAAGNGTAALAARSSYYKNDPFLYKRDNTFHHYNPGLVNSFDDGSSSNVKPTFLSDKYKKLAAAAENVRRKRQIEERLARLFGHSHTKSGEIEETTRPDPLETDELSNVAFEAPLVYTLH